ncbi:hypothetical protein K438DRAFT_1982679 [Mycena galopus ATCC 62051]|nr:hypothetical protein K438DRAFT_1982679 [Mycena galopus ATCC 62051]
MPETKEEMPLIEASDEPAPVAIALLYRRARLGQEELSSAPTPPAQHPVRGPEALTHPAHQLHPHPRNPPTHLIALAPPHTTTPATTHALG